MRSAAILCIEGLDVIRREAWSFCRISSSVRPCWELEEATGLYRDAEVFSRCLVLATLQESGSAESVFSLWERQINSGESLSATVLREQRQHHLG